MSQNNHSGNLPPKPTKRKTATEKTIVNSLLSATLVGLSANRIEVEATFTKGLPGFAVVGLVSSDIQESKERVKSALLTNDFKFPPLVGVARYLLSVWQSYFFHNQDYPPS